MADIQSPSDGGFRADLPRRHHLVTPGWIAALCRGDRVTAAPAQDWCIVEIGDGPPGPFLLGHIPGATYLDTNLLERPPWWQALPGPELQALLLRHGIGPRTCVLLYGRNMAAVGRAAHLMLVAGAGDIRVLDGGFPAWLRAGLAVATGQPPAVPAKDAADHHFTGRPHYLVHAPELRRVLQQGEGQVVSIRTRDEFIGATSGYRYIAAVGEIPGAVWGHAGGDDEDMNSVSAFQNPDGTMKPAHEICALWRAAGIVAQRRNVFYCGTGWRASAAFFYAWLMGWEHIGVYDGGWLAWSSDPANPRIVRTRSTAAEELSLPS